MTKGVDKQVSYQLRPSFREFSKQGDVSDIFTSNILLWGAPAKQWRNTASASKNLPPLH